MAIELEVWKPNPDKPGYLKLERRRTNGEVFDDLKAALTKAGMMPDEYFSCLDRGGVIPRYRWITCYAVTGGSEGHYSHIEVIGRPESMRAQFYDTSSPDGKNWHWHKIDDTLSGGPCIRHQIALGKTFEGMDRAQQIAAFCAKALDA